eukprot:scaffold4383_cov390-Prasinococcus_capsulatus_cf.AAC.9
MFKKHTRSAGPSSSYRRLASTAAEQQPVHAACSQARLASAGPVGESVGTMGACYLTPRFPRAGAV